MRHMFAAASLLLMAGCQQSENTSPSPYPTEAAAEATANEAAPVDPAALAWCPEVSRRLTRADCEDLTAIAASARQGVAAFNAPDPMVRGKAVTLQLAVGFKPEPVDTMTDNVVAMDNVADAAVDDMAGDESAPLSNAADVSETVARRNRPTVSPRRTQSTTPEEVVRDLPGRVVSYAPVVGRFMRASLTGEGFTVVARSPESQEVHADDQTTWEWDVTATRGDRHVLTLKTVVEGVTASGQRYPLRTTTRNQTISVEVGRWDRVADALGATPGWLKLVTGVVTALTALVIALWALRRALGGKGEEPPSPA